MQSKKELKTLKNFNVGKCNSNLLTDMKGHTKLDY